MFKQNRPVDIEQVDGAAVGALSHGRAATRPSGLTSSQGREDRGFRVDEGPSLLQTAPPQAPDLSFHAALDVSVGNMGPGGGEGGEKIMERKQSLHTPQNPLTSVHLALTMCPAQQQLLQRTCHRPCPQEAKNNKHSH